MTTQNSSSGTDLDTQPLAIAAPARGRNEPCPCGSKKKYKRCHGVDAAPKLSTPAINMSPERVDEVMKAQGMGGFDPSKMDPQAVSQMTQAFSRLPKSQMHRLQSLMQRAMSGKDVAQEIQEFEKTLPPDFVQMMQSFAGASGMSSEQGMSEAEARAIVEAAAKEGKISADEASEVLVASKDSGPGKEKGISKLWSRIAGKK